MVLVACSMGSVRIKKGVFREPRKKIVSGCFDSEFQNDHVCLCTSVLHKKNGPEKITIPTKQQTLSWMLNVCTTPKQKSSPKSGGDSASIFYKNPLTDSFTTPSEKLIQSCTSKLSSEKSLAKLKFRQKIRDNLRKSQTKPPIIPENEISNSNSRLNLAEIVKETPQIPIAKPPLQNQSQHNSRSEATSSSTQTSSKESKIPKFLSQVSDKGSRFPLNTCETATETDKHLRQLMRKYTLLKLEQQKQQLAATKVNKATQMYEHITTSQWYTQTWIEKYLFGLDQKPYYTQLVDERLSSPSLKENNSNCDDVIIGN